MLKVIPGKYRHYKGGMYEVISEAVDSETLEKMVVYKSLHSTKSFKAGTIWVRPKKMFLEKVKVGEKLQPRFSLIKAVST